ncbi:MAG: DUF3857 and transglutaminase domain-containing protein [Williamsia sp.]|nr:DUF3857 and transglutaminase domain-containing protein [Williamsia sp.]
MKKTLYFSLFFLASLPALAGDGDYAASKIPAALLKNAHVVIRNNERLVQLKSLDKMVIREKMVMTVLDEKGDRFAYMAEAYDKFTSIESMDGTLYDADGKKLKSVRKSEIKDESGTGDNNLADDHRYKHHSFYHKIYPYTVEYETEIIERQSMFYPTWDPVDDEHIAVEHSVIVVEVPKDYVLRYKCYNCVEPVISNGDKKQYKWELANFSAVTLEFASPSWKYIVPYVLIAPSQFQIDDYTGNMTDWNEFGKFSSVLNQGRDVLPDAIKQKVHQLTDGLSTREQKVDALYSYLQNNTHYISIQLGIGGWRPFDAAYVSSKAYGDCKALSNYMVALLKEAGITSYYTLIKAGEVQDIITEFPSQQFNHVITCVPNGKDTMWLECTSQTKAAGYMGEFTGNRHALLITEQGGRLVSTPSYSYKDNIRQRTIKASINEEGHLTAQVRTNYKAVAGEHIYGMIHQLSNDKIKEYLKEKIDLPNFEITQFSYKENRSQLPSVDESIDLLANHYASISGKRIFVVPNLLSKMNTRLDATEERKYDIELGSENTIVDSVEITVPAGYRLEALSPDTKLEAKFGKYSSFLQLDGNKLRYYRRLEQYKGHYAAKEYSDLAKFYDQVYKADRSRVVLVKNEQ